MYLNEELLLQFVCTIALAWQVFEDAPILFGANRDEQHDRPSESPAHRAWETEVVAPLDLESGGTWMGYNEHGLLVAITNRWDDMDRTGDRSRGLLVCDALAYEDAESAIQAVERELDGHVYDGFNLLAVDETAALLLESGEQRRVRTLEPGIHVVVNVGANGDYDIPDGLDDEGTQQAENAERLRRVLRPEPGEEPDEWLERTGGILGDHEYGVCIHENGFGTQSSSLIRMDTDGFQYEHANGPPCEHQYEPVDASLKAGQCQS